MWSSFSLLFSLKLNSWLSSIRLPFSSNGLSFLGPPGAISPFVTALKEFLPPSGRTGASILPDVV